MASSGARHGAAGGSDAHAALEQHAHHDDGSHEPASDLRSRDSGIPFTRGDNADNHRSSSTTGDIAASADGAAGVGAGAGLHAGEVVGQVLPHMLSPGGSGGSGGGTDASSAAAMKAKLDKYARVTARLKAALDGAQEELAVAQQQLAEAKEQGAAHASALAAKDKEVEAAQAKAAAAAAQLEAYRSKLQQYVQQQKEQAAQQAQREQQTVLASATPTLLARVIVAMPSVAEPGTLTRTAWYCVTDGGASSTTSRREGGPAVPASSGTVAAEWFTEDALMSQVPASLAQWRANEAFVAPSDVAQLRQRMLEVQDELRKYRVRSEALLRQKDAELAAARERALQAQSERIITGVGDGTPSSSGMRGDSFGAVGTASAGQAGASSGLFGRGAAGGPAGVLGSSGNGAGVSGGVDELATNPSAMMRRIGEYQAQVERLLRSRAELQERETSLRDQLVDAQRELQAMRDENTAFRLRVDDGQGGGTASGSAPMSPVAVRAPPSAAAASIAAPAAAAAAAAELEASMKVLQMEHDKLSSEYAAYRKRAVGMLKEKDDQLRRMEDELTAARSRIKRAAEAEGSAHQPIASQQATNLQHAAPAVATPAPTKKGGLPPPSPATPAHGFAASPAGAAARHIPATSGVLGAANAAGAAAAGPPDAARWEYLRNVLVRYLSTPPDSDVRAKLEPALMMVLGLSAVEIAGIKTGRHHATPPLYQGQAATAGADAAGLLTGTFSSLFDTAASLLSGAPTPAPTTSLPGARAFTPGTLATGTTTTTAAAAAALQSGPTTPKF